MAIVVAVVLGLLTLAYVLYPLYQRTTTPAPAAANVDQNVAEEATGNERELAARNALQEVELDYQLGNIAEPDYRTLREHYMQRAASALKARYEREQKIDEEIEEQLRKMRENDEKAAS